MLTYLERRELAEHGICFTWSDNLGKKYYPKGFGFFPLTEEINKLQGLNVKEYPELSQKEVNDLIQKKFGYFVFNPSIGEVHKKKQRILPNVKVEIGKNIVSTPCVVPIEKHQNEKTIAATHGIIDGEVYEIIDRGNRAYLLSNNESYFKDNTKNETRVVWVRMIVTDYDDIDYPTW
jgi:hypothetical protein